MASMHASDPPAAVEHRSRLLEGMAHAVAAKGYADTTIADIVREASVSRRTFYEHFSDKAECLIALYEAASGNAIKVLRAAIDPRVDWRVQLEQTLAAYFGALAQNPVLLRTLFVEVLGLGAPGLAARRRANQQLVELMLEVVNAAPQGRPGAVALTAPLATAVVGGINEMVLVLIEQGRVQDLPSLIGPAATLVRAVAAPQGA